MPRKLLIIGIVMLKINHLKRINILFTINIKKDFILYLIKQKSDLMGIERSMIMLCSHVFLNITMGTCYHKGNWNN